MNPASHRCLYNHELLIIATSRTPYQTYETDISDEQVIGLIQELQPTAVDTVMCCPTAWRRNLWPSQLDRHWQDEAPSWREPTFEHDFKYYEKAYYRLRRYMLQGKDPVALSLQAAHEAGKSFFISYRMNDHHYLDDLDNPCHNTFWRQHPEYRFVAPNTRQHGYLNYLADEVRQYYFQILEELVTRYDIDGLELDFMRSPCYFPDIEAGRPVMNAFVHSIRQMLDRFSRQRGRRLPLCVRLPHHVDRCQAIGLDVSHWAAEHWIDMANLSSFYINDLELDIAAYRTILPGVRLYGEMHFISDLGELPGPFRNNVSRKTSSEMYHALADQYWAEGADGLSFFNFAYVRHHHFNEPRRKGITDAEPPFAVIDAVMDQQRLTGLARHYYWRSDKLLHEMDGSVNLSFRLSGSLVTREPARLRLVTREPFAGLHLHVELNGHRLTPTVGLGELYLPLSQEALPSLPQQCFFPVKPAWLEHQNRLIIRADRGKAPDIACLDLALDSASTL